ncbi:alpha/beta fold hydrolase [Granulicella sibirica]|uniref:Alpha/beta hydrolase fold n=1 Tax=Granulicella sibirica TaxID=2479048 RepID=A0A4V1L674_9BACT|nr:alpha/beta hydrolase [Granulicella sibirica]RXH58274.1 Alpha/beta hydrolase fold [Granulicella sibirica]
MRRLSLALLLACGGLGLKAQTAPEPLLVKTGTLPMTKAVLVFGQKIVYYDTGVGPTIVLVHGFGSQAMFDWGQVIMPLAAKHHRVIALDQIGFGSSDKPFIDYSIQTYVDFLGEFLRTLHVDHFTLAGESLGGWVASSYAIQALAPENTGRYPLPKPERLILEDAAGHRTLGDGPSIPIAGTLKDAAGVGIIFYDKSRVTEDFIRQNFAIKLKANDGFTQRSLRGNPKLAEEIVSDKLASITIPTLVVWGGNDMVVPLDDGKDFAAKIPGAKLVVVPECGHVPSTEKPAAFLDAVVPFLE